MPGLVLKVSIPGMEFRNHATSRLLLLAQAKTGTTSWHCRQQKLYWSECLSGIPGPWANAGAKRWRVRPGSSETSLACASWNYHGKVITWVGPIAGFSYRASIFNSTQMGVHRVASDIRAQRSAPKMNKPTLRNILLDAPRSNASADASAVRTTAFQAMLIVQGDEDCRSAVRSSRISSCNN